MRTWRGVLGGILIVALGSAACSRRGPGPETRAAPVGGSPATAYLADPCAPGPDMNQGLAGAACAGAGKGCGCGGASSDAETASAGFDNGDFIPPLFGSEAEVGEALARATLGVARPDGRDEGRRSAPTTWRRSTLVPHTSRLSVGDDADLPLEAMDVGVRVDGFRARVTVDLFFRNLREEAQLEGTFHLRLPPGATPHHLAFGETALETPVFVAAVAGTVADIRAQRAASWEAPREARMVPREKAARAYTDTVRQQVDPALLEWSGAGVFSARVFPLVPGKLHRIVVAYDVDLLSVGDDLVYRLDVPRDVGELEVDLTVAGGDAQVAWTDGETSAPATPVEGRYHWRNPTSPTLLVRIRDPGTLLLTGDDPGTGPHFATRIRPALEATPGRPRERAVFLVDVSLSSNPDQMNVWLALLESILEQNRDDLSEFALAFFNVETFWWRPGFHANTPENVAAALAQARGLLVEGATDLGQAFRALGDLDGTYDLFLLSDGAPTWGQDDLYALSTALPTGTALFAYATGTSGGDPRTLGHLARESGGALFTVAGESAVPAAARAHRARPWQLDAVSLAGCEDLMFAGRPTTLFPGQVLTLVGRGIPDDDALVVLTFERDGKRKMHMFPIHERLASHLAARAYGQVAVGQLEALGDSTRDVARAYACHYRVVGQTCSLLMLETEADYARYEIEPEEDAYLIGARPAARAVEETLDAHAEDLGDPKRAFFAWLARIEASGVEVSLPETVRYALSRLPAASFRAAPAPLACAVRAAAEVPADVRAALAERTLTYEAIFAEAERRRQAHGAADALRALGSLVEHHPGDLVLARDVAFTAMAWALPGQAHGLLRRVMDKRPWELPGYHALALSAEAMGHVDLAVAYFEIAMAAARPGGTYGDLRLIAAFDYLRLLRRIERGQATSAMPDFVRARRETVARLPKVRTADLVIVMGWNTDRTDVDLYVTDPNDEVCSYQNRDTRIGAHMTTDVTGGYGPEMFVLRRAVPGDYVVEAHYYASDTLRTASRSKVYVTLYEGWGTPEERVTRTTVPLEATGERQRIALVHRE